MNFDQLRYIAERSTIGEHREVRLAVSIAERPGSFAHSSSSSASVS